MFNQTEINKKIVDKEINLWIKEYCEPIGFKVKKEQVVYELTQFRAISCVFDGTLDIKKFLDNNSLFEEELSTKFKEILKIYSFSDIEIKRFSWASEKCSEIISRYFSTFIYSHLFQREEITILYNLVENKRKELCIELMNKINVALTEQLVVKHDNNIVSLNSINNSSECCIGYNTFSFENLFLTDKEKTYTVEISADINTFELGIINYILICGALTIRVEWKKIVEENNLWKYLKEVKGK